MKGNLFFTVFNLNSDVMPHDSSDVIKRDFRPNCVEFESRVFMPESIFNFILDDFDSVGHAKVYFI